MTVTDAKRSPYTGRPVDEWLTQEIELHDRDDDEIGKVVEINPDFIVAETDGGFLGLGERRVYYIPREFVMREDEDDWYLRIDKDEIESMNWVQPPTQSAWSQELQEGATPVERRGGTRIRRYEEELEADTVERQAGEVVIKKNVVEEKRTIEVPVRREEVNIERRPVSGDAVGDDEAFSGESIRVPVMEEEVQVRKVARPVEEIEVTKTQTQDTRRVDDTVRREEIDVDDTSARGTGGAQVNWDKLEGNWNQFKGAVREKWGDLTDDDLDRIKGNREQFVGRLQERYGVTRDDAERQADDFVRDLKDSY